MGRQQRGGLCTVRAVGVRYLLPLPVDSPGHEGGQVMALVIRLSCDKCNGEASTSTIGTATDARVDRFAEGWFYDGEVDLCPVCTGLNPNYWVAEPF